MKTLYDVLNIRADDNAESVRNAFRKAVKANHPDLNAGDPDAQSRFVQIVRANDILRDPELRAIYDGMLEFERQQCRPQSKLVARGIAANAITGFVLAFVLAGAFTYLSKTSDVTARESAAVAAGLPLAPVDAAGHLKAVGLAKSSAAVLGAPASFCKNWLVRVLWPPKRDVAAGLCAGGQDANSHRRPHHGAERRGHVRGLLGLRRSYHAGLFVSGREIS
ncbi:MAG TPA: J domain-containing protein [Xanthobacteraceae bacterium]|jgi:curved DNA-binding protein CbpA